MRRFIPIAFVLLLSNVLFAQDVWRPLEGPTGAPGAGVRRLDSARLIATTMRGTYVTVDGGATWRAALGLPRPPLAIHTAPSGMVYAVQSGLSTGESRASRVFLSTDGGATFAEWSDTSRRSYIYWVIEDPASGDVIGYGNGIWRYPRNGAAPTELFTSDSTVTGAVAFGDELIVTTRYGLYRFDPAAPLDTVRLTRPAMSYGLTVPRPGVLMMHDLVGNVFRSDDTGRTWRTMAAFAGGRIEELAVGRDGSVIAITQFGVAFRSTDVGETWLAVREPGIARFRYIERGSDGGLAASVADTSAVQHFALSDDGVAWTLVLFENAAWTFDAVQSRPGHPLYAATPEYLYRSTDGGSSWDRVPFDLPVTFERRLALSGGGVLFQLGTDEDGLFRSTDRGSTWTVVSAGNFGATNWLVPIDDRLVLGDAWLDHLRLFDVDSDRVTNIELPNGPGQLWAGAVDSSGVAYVVSDSSVFRSTDRGRTWTTTGIVLAEQGAVIAASPSGSLFIAAVRGAILRSTDAGLTWHERASLPDGAAASTIAASPAGTLYAGTGSHGVYRSSDEGMSWHVHASGLPHGRIKGFSFGDAGVVFANTIWGGIYTSREAPSSVEVTRVSRVAGGILHIAPNPIDEEARAILSLPVSGRIELSLHTILGERVMTFVDELVRSGPNDVRLDLSGVLPGIYLLRLDSPAGTSQARIVVR